MSTNEDTSETAQRHTFDIAAGVFLAAMSLVALLWFIPANVSAGSAGFDLSPRFFPSLAAGTVFVLSVILVIVRSAAARGRTGDTAGRGDGWAILLETACWLGLAALTYLGIRHLGFLPTAIALFAACVTLSRYRTIWLAALLAVVFPVAVDSLAWLVFQVDLP